MGFSGRRVNRAFLDRLRFGPNPLGVFGRSVGPTLLDWLRFGPFFFKALGSGRLSKGAGSGPKVQGSYSVMTGTETGTKLFFCFCFFERKLVPNLKFISHGVRLIRPNRGGTLFTMSHDD